MNLLKETISVITKHNHSESDVLWCGLDGKYFSWDQFEKISDVEYDNSFGTNEIPLDLLVVGKNWWLERHEYDGSEWWEHKTLPIRPKESFFPEKIIN